jgi:hypothetical protein
MRCPLPLDLLRSLLACGLTVVPIDVSRVVDPASSGGTLLPLPRCQARRVAVAPARMG